MSRLSKLAAYIGARPQVVIELILAVALGLFALYIGGPWYYSAPTTTIGSAIEDDIVRLFTALLYGVPAVLTIGGVRNQSVRTWGVFGLFMGYLFSAILRLLTFGFVPVFWWFLLALALIAAVLYIVESRRDDK